MGILPSRNAQSPVSTSFAKSLITWLETVPLNSTLQLQLGKTPRQAEGSKQVRPPSEGGRIIPVLGALR